MFYNELLNIFVALSFQ